MKVKKQFLGTTTKGKSVYEFCGENPGGMSFRAMNYGATLLSLRAPDREQNCDELTLGFDNLAQYEGEHPYFGATVGRYANRIANGRFRLEGMDYQLDCNKGGHHLHGGSRGLSRRVWDASPFSDDGMAGVRFSISSPHLDQGYPGRLDVEVTIALSEANELIFCYEAECDRPTPVSLTNHTYWNLGGECSGKIYDHEIFLDSDRYLEVDGDLIPTGRVASVEETPFDLRGGERLGEHIKASGGIDHCFVLSNNGRDMKMAADVRDPESGRRMRIFTNCPAIQFYTANYLEDFRTRCGIVNPHEAFCLETQEYPDAVNHDNFPDVILRPGHKYQRRTVHNFSII